MARVEIKMPEEFLLKLSKLNGRTDEVLSRVLTAGGKIMEEKVKESLQAVIGRDTKHPSRATGELVEALGVSPALFDRKGNHNIKIGFAEPRQDGGSNAKLANIIEYGKSGQPPKPFLKPAKSAGRQPALLAMKAALEEELKGL